MAQNAHISFFTFICTSARIYNYRKTVEQILITFFGGVGGQHFKFGTNSYGLDIFWRFTNKWRKMRILILANLSVRLSAYTTTEKPLNGF
jgi:hypothetical protein